MAKPNKKDQITKLIKAHKLIVVLLIILLLVLINLGYNKYKDWDNARMIQGLSRDFPALVAQIEDATGLELQITSNCMTTQEKFSGGIKTCEYLVVHNDIDEELLSTAKGAVLESDTFKRPKITDNKLGYDVEYHNKNSCTLSNRDRFYFNCIVAVRDANVPKIKQLLGR